MTLTKPIQGIIGACLTPFDDKDRVDYKALEREMEFLIGDCDAITIAAVEAAEYTMLSREERRTRQAMESHQGTRAVPT